MSVLGKDQRVKENPYRQVATKPGTVLRFQNASEPGEVVAIYTPITGEQPQLPEFKPRESKSGSTYFKSLMR